VGTPPQFDRSAPEAALSDGRPAGKSLVGGRFRDHLQPASLSAIS